MESHKEKILIQYVRSELNSGKTRISIPGSLIIDVRDEIILELKRLCKLNGVSVSILT